MNAPSPIVRRAGGVLSEAIGLPQNAPGPISSRRDGSPSVASEQQGEELVNYLLSEFENNPNGIWQTNMFGKPLSSLVRESIAGKLDAMPVPARNKMRKTVTRIVNEGKGGVLCILL